MARNNYKGTKNRVKRRKKPRYTQVEKTAFLMGQVERGLKNPDSLITASFERGANKPEKRQKKSLF